MGPPCSPGHRPSPPMPQVVLVGHGLVYVGWGGFYHKEALLWLARLRKMRARWGISMLGTLAADADRFSYQTGQAGCAVGEGTPAGKCSHQQH